MTKAIYYINRALLLIYVDGVQVLGFSGPIAETKWLSLMGRKDIIIAINPSEKKKHEKTSLRRD